jgi:hypothetical protein
MDVDYIECRFAELGGPVCARGFFLSAGTSGRVLGLRSDGARGYLFAAATPEDSGIDRRICRKINTSGAAQCAHVGAINAGDITPSSFVPVRPDGSANHAALVADHA